MANDLVIRQTFAKGFALLCPGDSLFQANPTQRFHSCGHCHPFAVKIGHYHQEALILLANEVRDRNPHVVKIQCGRVRCPPALLFVQLCTAKTFRISWNQQHGNAPAALTASANRRGYPVCTHAAGDISFGPINNVMITVTHGSSR